MTVAYVISAYKLPEQLCRLVRRLAAPGASFAIHVDRKTPPQVHRRMLDGLAGIAGVRLLPRHRCEWGGFGHVRASLAGIADLLRRDVSFDYLILLTGQDYPLRPPAGIARFLAEAGGSSFMSSWPLPHAPWSGRGGLDRIERWHLVGPHRLHLSLPLPRRVPDGLVVRGGSPYWCLARPLVEHVHQVTESRPDVQRFFEHSYIPDEMFFQTVLAASPYADSIADDNLRYIDWTATPGPRILTRDDLPRLLASEKLFARKFDTSRDTGVLDRLDEHLDAQLEAAAR